MDIDGAGRERNEDVDDDSGEERPDAVLEPSELATVAAERTQRIRQYLKDRQARREVVTTTRTPLDQVVDWVPIESLAPNGRVADPPGEDGFDTEFLDHPADGNEVRPAELIRF
ncbi:MAG: hypothetical protein H0U16_11890, partial [Actinobacteria bacterium]|nr:hypothetical protein [Actinomycetota bacterium]